MSILRWISWPWIISGCWLTILLIIALVIKARERRRWAQSGIHLRHLIEQQHRAQVARCVALDHCPYPPSGCGDACGAEQPRDKAAAEVQAVKGRHRADR